MDLLIVGSGFFGLTIAERAAASGRKVTVIDRRHHIGGNAYSEDEPETGIEVHRYGAHLFHTSNPTVWEYVNRFTTFTDYVHRVYTNHKGVVFPLPINLGTINQFFQAAYSPDEARALVHELAGEFDAKDAANLEEKGIALIGRPLYEAFIRDYTAKQWQTDPKDLPAEVISRLPVRYTYDNRYFNDTWEGLPDRRLHRVARADGRPPEHRGEARHRLLRRVAAAQQGGDGRAGARSSTPGPSTATSTTPRARCRGARSTSSRRCSPVGDFQGTSVMNYADADVPYTRIHEFRHFHPERADRYPTDKTVIMREFSRFADARRRAVLPGQHAGGPRGPARLPRAREGREGRPLRRAPRHLPVPRHAHGDRLGAVDVEQPARLTGLGGPHPGRSGAVG